MLPHSHLVVLTRNETWTGPGEVATEPHECGWAREAMVFVRALKEPTWTRGAGRLRVQISPDGMRWLDHGTEVALPTNEGGMTAVPVERFGGWLRLAGTLAQDDAITVLVSIHLKA